MTTRFMRWPLDFLPQPELDRHFDDDVHRRAEAARGLEAPLADRVHRAFVESSAKAPHDLQRADATVAAHHDLENDVAGESAPPRFLRVIRLDLADELGRFDAAPRPIRSSPGAAAGSLSDPGTRTGTQSGAAAAASTAAVSRSLTLGRRSLGELAGTIARVG